MSCVAKRMKGYRFPKRRRALATIEGDRSMKMYSIEMLSDCKKEAKTIVVPPVPAPISSILSDAPDACGPARSEMPLMTSRIWP